MIRAAGDGISASRAGSAAQADPRHVPAVYRRFSAVLAAVVAIGRGADPGLAIETDTISCNLAGLAKLTGAARAAAIDVRFRPVLLAVEALRVAALVIRARDVGDAVGSLVAGFAFVAQWTLRPAAVDVCFRVVESAVLARRDVARAADT